MRPPQSLDPVNRHLSPNQGVSKRLHPLICEVPLEDNCGLGIGELNYPYDPEHGEITRQRVKVSSGAILFHVPRDTESHEYKDLLRTRVWTVASVKRIAGGDDAVNYYLEQLLEYADWTMARRQVHGENERWNIPSAAAGTILSYPPEEEVPSAILEVIPRYLSRFNKPTADPADLIYGYSAVLAWIVLGAASDGLGLRKQIHPLPHEAVTPDEDPSPTVVEQ